MKISISFSDENSKISTCHLDGKCPGIVFNAQLMLCNAWKGMSKTFLKLRVSSSQAKLVCSQAELHTGTEYIINQKTNFAIFLFSFSSRPPSFQEAGFLNAFFGVLFLHPI